MKDKLDGYFEYERKREMLLETAGLADRETALLEGRLSQEALAELERQEGILGLTDQTRKSVAKSLSSIVYGGFHSATFSQRIWANQESLRGIWRKD